MGASSTKQAGAAYQQEFPAIVQVSNAVLAADIQAWLTHPEHHQLRSHLYRDITSCKIEHKTGVVENKSLRGQTGYHPLVISG